MWVGAYDQFAFLQLKIFGRHFIVFTLQKGFLKLQMAHPMQQNLFKSMKV
jgi:hypothetical protein